MNRILTLAFLIVVSFLYSFQMLHAEEFIGLQHGNILKAIHLRGQLSVFCTGADVPNSAITTCEDQYLTPNSYDFFVGPKGLSATYLQLISKAQNGEVHSKESDYDSVKGRSTDHFNLWYYTLFQRPLLEVGINQITYILTDSRGKVVKRGAFEVNVERSPLYECPYGSYNSINDSDCTFPQNMCSNYFYENNNCQ